MENLKIETAKVVGTPTSNLWSQVHTFVPEEPEKMNKRGRLLAVISLKIEQMGVETVALGREILARLHEEYYGSLEGEVFKKLGQTLEKINKEWPGVEITAVVVLGSPVGEAVYVGILGLGKVYLKRGGFLKLILGGEGEGIIKTGSGLVQTGDVVLLGSKTFFEIVGEGVIKASLGSDTPQEMVESLAPIVLSRQDLGQAAAVICSFNQPLEVAEELTSFNSEVSEAEPVRKKDNLVKLLFSRATLLITKLPLPKIDSKTIRILRQDREKQSRKMVSLALILIALFLMSLVLGGRRRKQLDLESKAETLFVQAEKKYLEAKEKIDLDSSESLVLLRESASLLEEAISYSSGKEIQDLKNEIDQLILKTDKTRSLGELATFFDLKLIRDQATGSAACREGSQLFVLDNKNGVVYTLDLEKKSSSQYPDPEFTQAKSILCRSERIFILSATGIFEVKIVEKKITLVIKKDPSWGEILSLNSFSGNLYLLDGGKRAIWQYLATGSGYTGPKVWLGESDSETIKEPLSFAIDGSIWVLEKANLLKFIRGKKDSFGLKGIEGIENLPLSSIYTDEESQFLYLLNSQNRSVLIFSKEGLLEASYQWSGSPENPLIMVPWEEKREIFLIKDNLISRFSINGTSQ